MTYWGSHVLEKGDIRLADRDWAIVTPGIFDILDFEIISGDPKKNFEGQAGIILTKNVALGLFGKTDVVGEVIDNSRFESIEVLAVMEDMPRNSSYQFKELYVIDTEQFPDNWQRFLNNWDTRFFQTWVLLKEGASPEDVYSQKPSESASRGGRGNLRQRQSYQKLGKWRA